MMNAADLQFSDNTFDVIFPLKQHFTSTLESIV